MQAACDIAELVERGADLLAGGVDSRLRLGVVRELAAEQLQLERERDQPLLGPVVEIALEPLALLLPGLDDAPARVGQLLELRLSSACRRPFSSAISAAALTASSSSGSSGERRRVDQRRDVLAVALDDPRRSPLGGAVEVEAPSVRIRPGAELRQPVGDL